MKKNGFYILISLIILIFLTPGCEEEDTTMFFDTPLVIFEFKNNGRGSVSAEGEDPDEFNWTKTGISLFFRS